MRLQEKIPQLLQRYAGNEKELVQAVRLKYENTSGADASAPGNERQPPEEVMAILQNMKIRKERDQTDSGSSNRGHVQRRDNLDSLEGWTAQDLAAEVTRLREEAEVMQLEKQRIIRTLMEENARKEEERQMRDVDQRKALVRLAQELAEAKAALALTSHTQDTKGTVARMKNLLVWRGLELLRWLPGADSPVIWVFRLDAPLRHIMLHPSSADKRAKEKGTEAGSVLRMQGLETYDFDDIEVITQHPRHTAGLSGSRGNVTQIQPYERSDFLVWV